MSDHKQDSNEDHNDQKDNVGADGTIPNSEDGVAVGHTGESSFEPEEDEQAPSE